MDAEFKIVEVLNTRKGQNEHGLVFKVQWISSKEIAYMQFDMAKKKYPLIVLEYLVSRIKQRPINQKEESPVESKKPINSPQTQHSDATIICPLKQKKHQGNSVDKFFHNCVFCDSQKICTKMLDYDAIVPIDSNMAYPVFFKLPGKQKDRQKRVTQQIKSQSQKVIRQKSVVK